MAADYVDDCPIDECEGIIEFYTEEGEQGPYADGSYQYWTYLLMSDRGKCSEGHEFTVTEQEKLEKDASEKWSDRSLDYEPSWSHD